MQLISEKGYKYAMRNVNIQDYKTITLGAHDLRVVPLHFYFLKTLTLFHRSLNCFHSREHKEEIPCKYTHNHDFTKKYFLQNLRIIFFSGVWIRQEG